MAPSTFASAAAAGTNANSPRTESSAEWSRRTNGATQTFRRPSLATSISTSQPRENNVTQNRNSTEAVGVYIPPHLSASRNGASSEHRYSRDQLLSLFRNQHESDDLNDDLSSCFVAGFEPNIANGTSGPSWGRRDEQKETPVTSDVCWDRDGTIHPLALREMTAEEVDIFSGSVNSPLKPPTQNAKDGTPRDVVHRKSSISQSQNSPGGYGLASPTARQGTRRRDTSESFPFPAAQTAGGATSRLSREETHGTTAPPPALLRRRTDFNKEQSSTDPEDREKEKQGQSDAANPYNGLKRSTTAGLGTSTWGASQGSAFGSFGSFALGPPSAGPTTDKRPGFGSMRGESRFKGLMKDASDDDSGSLREKSSLASLGRTSEAERTPTDVYRHMGRETDRFSGQETLSGSAALQGADDVSPPRHRAGGFAGLGQDSGIASTGFRDDYPHQTPQHRHEVQGEPMSPTDTNPYQSPENDKPDASDIGAEGLGLRGHLPGLGGYVPDQDNAANLMVLGQTSRVSAAHEAAAGDRSQTSSAGPMRGGAGFGGFGTLGGLPGLGTSSAWAPAQPSADTPTRERTGFGGAFGEGIFSPVGEPQPQALPGFSGGNPFGSASGLSNIGRGSRMATLLPQALQEQQNRTAEEGMYDPFERLQPGFGAGNAGRGGFGSTPHRDTESPFRAGRGVFDDMIRAAEPSSTFGEAASSGFPTSGVAQTALGTSSTIGPQRGMQQPGQRESSVGSSSSSQPPVAQVRQMVMPDRMRWIYKDPHGNTQGPWSGLEMHDWYKAGFFTPELLIRKAEDPDYEPLAQLIRRIGNSREPFLVPQIGVPHEPAVRQGWTGPMPGNPQPPFPNSFPSFGTTLTAEQQNALERRKQEEQYLMARQKEHLAQQQLMMKMQHMHPGQHGILPQQLHHHSSTHSLHSQPSFGSITSPAGYQPSPTQAPTMGGPSLPGFLEGAFRGQPGAGLDMLSNIREDEIPELLERLNLTHVTQGGTGSSSGQAQMDPNHAAQVAAMLNDRARLEREQHDFDTLEGLQQTDPNAQMTADRLRQFQDLRSDYQTNQELASPEEVVRSIEHAPQQRFSKPSGATDHDIMASEKQLEQSITQQVQAAVTAKASAQQTTWTRVDAGTMQPIVPPPQSSSPMPAPIAQRKQNVADTLVARSRSQTPSLDTPSTSIAPWAKESVEATKGPSLKEIQAAEAKKAAQQEEIASAARRAALAKELAAQEAIVSPQPGLPSSSTWANVSPASANPSSSVWAKAGATKTTVPTLSTKKTLQQIQKEEEARKQRTTPNNTSAINSAGSAQPLSSGKRYADLASKVASVSPGPMAPGGAWTTVGASGKVKTPIPAGTGAGVRSVSGGIPTTTQMPIKPKQPVRSTTMGVAQLGRIDANEEFKKWAVKELGSHLNKGINADSFVENLLLIGLDPDILTEAVHYQSQTIDSRHFAEEFIRRRKLADRGITPDATPSIPSQGASSGSGGWSEVAKKGPAVVQESPSSFKVVAAKKKGGKR